MSDDQPVLDWPTRVLLAGKGATSCHSINVRWPMSEAELAAAVVAEPLRDPCTTRALIRHLSEALDKLGEAAG